MATSSRIVAPLGMAAPQCTCAALLIPRIAIALASIWWGAACSGSGSLDVAGNGAGNVAGSSGTSGTPTGAAGTTGGEQAAAVEPNPTLDIREFPTGVGSVGIEISEADQATLEAEPWLAEDVSGTFVDEQGVRYESVSLNYRGAYALLNLVNANRPQRNWKVKFGSEAPYLDRREWNFNYEPHVRQKLAYDLMRFAGVRVPPAEHVLLRVNGEPRGITLRYADPDSKGWLHDAFGSDRGDLFKAAYDLPGEPQYFALLTYLGPNDQDYFLHFNKKLNNDNEAATDYSSLRTFISALNDTPDAEFPDWLRANFDVERFTSYLVVSNFIANWDSYPQRPKNYWLYQSPLDTRWSYVPWDMDGTFQFSLNGNSPLGALGSIFHEFDQFDGRDPATDEGTERPLVRRMMQQGEFRAAYVARYRELTSTILSAEYLTDRATRLLELLEGVASEEDGERLSENNDEILDFVQQRSENVARQLGEL
jgi:hypothetical protein